MADPKIGGAGSVSQATGTPSEASLADKFQAFLKKNKDGDKLLASIQAEASRQTAQGEEVAYLDQMISPTAAQADSVDEVAYLDQISPTIAQAADGDEVAYLDQISPTIAQATDGEEVAYLDQISPTIAQADGVDEVAYLDQISPVPA